MQYSLLAMDLDGTLLNSRTQISAANIAAIQEFRARGGSVVICSGRSPLSTRWIAANVGLTEPIITYNGAILQEADGRGLSRNAGRGASMSSCMKGIRCSFRSATG